MIKRILNYRNEEDKEILSQKSETVENIDEVKKGLSAIQLGVNKKVCICSWGGDKVLLINPVITRSRGEQEYLEGCLSVPGVYKKVTRFQKVWCSYLDENGEQQEIAQGGRMSDIIQHELDHFEGECKLYEG